MIDLSCLKPLSTLWAPIIGHFGSIQKYSLNFKIINLIYDLNIIEKKYQAGYTKFLFAFFAHAQVDLKTSSSPFEFFILFKSISKNIIKQNKFCSKRQNNTIINKKRATNISLEI